MKSPIRYFGSKGSFQNEIFKRFPITSSYDTYLETYGGGASILFGIKTPKPIGGMMNKCLESCADTYEANKKYDNWTEPGALVNQFDETVKVKFKMGQKYFKKFRGMSTKEV